MHDHFWGEILRSAAKSLRNLVFPQSLSKTVVNNFQVAIFIHQNIFKLEISVHDTLAVQVPNCKRYLSSVEFYNFLTQTLLCFKNFVELSTFDEGHHKVEPCLRLEEIVHSDKEGVITAEKNIFF
jgi:hypothetical protein